MFEPLDGMFGANQVVRTEREADSAITEQRNLWVGLLQRVQSTLQQIGDNNAVSVIGHILNQLVNYAGLFERPHDPDRGFVVSGLIPLLLRSGTDIDTFATTRPYDLLGVILAEAGDGFSEILRQTGYPLDRQSHLFGSRAQIAATRYLLEKREANLSRRIGSAVQEALGANATLLHQNVDASNRAVRDLESHSAELIAKLEQRNLDHQATLQSIQEVEQARAESVAKEWITFMEQSRRDIEAAKALAFEAAAFRSARQIWLGKKWKHNLTFGIGLFALAAVIASGIVALIYNWETVLAAVPKNGQGEPVASFLVFIIVPLIAAAWVLRIFARLVTNALTLGEDAEQRRAMLETYFSLVGSKDAKMEPSDRILILNAIFRPLPGHQSEDVAPPTLLDLTKEALTAKKAG